MIRPSNLQARLGSQQNTDEYRQLMQAAIASYEPILERLLDDENLQSVTPSFDEAHAIAYEQFEHYRSRVIPNSTRNRGNLELRKKTVGEDCRTALACASERISYPRMASGKANSREEITVKAALAIEYLLSHYAHIAKTSEAEAKGFLNMLLSRGEKTGKGPETLR